MAAPPLVLADNLVNVAAYPGHAVSGVDSVTAIETPGHEGWRVGTGRRSAYTNYWAAQTANAAQTITLQGDRPRAANCLFLDRGHNLAGIPIVLRGTNDPSVATNWQSVLSLTIPASSAPNNLFDTSYGVVMEDGAWGCAFPPVSFLYWQLYIPPLAGFVPMVVGMYLGLAYQPGHQFLTPWGEDTAQLRGFKETVTEWGWSGGGPAVPAKATTMSLKLLTDDEYDVARLMIMGNFGARRPMWVCFDTAQADRSFLAIRQPAPIGFTYEPNWFPRQGKFALIEHEPLRP